MDILSTLNKCYCLYVNNLNGIETNRKSALVFLPLTIHVIVQREMLLYHRTRPSIERLPQQCTTKLERNLFP